MAHRPNNVKSLRLDRGLSAEDLASRSGVCLKTLYSIERGLPCHTGTQKKILRGLGMSIGLLHEVFPQHSTFEEELTP